MSAIESNNAIFGHNRVEFHVDRVKAIVIALSSILFGLVLAVPPSMHTASVASGSAVVSAFVALGGAVVLVAVGIYLLLRVAMWRGPAVVIDAFGIHDRRAGAVMTPWSTIQDLRFLDPHGHRIALDLGGAEPSPHAKHSSRRAALFRSRGESLTIIDTFFLRSITGNRVLDFVMPLTALTPIDLSETPVSEPTLKSDARITRNRTISVWIFLLVSGPIPSLAAISLLL